MQRNTTFLLMCALCLGLLAVACADPAANAPDAVVHEAEPEPVAEAPQDEMAAMEGTLYSFAEGSTVGFVGSKVTGSHEGGFKSFKGGITVPDSNLEKASVDVLIDATSLWSDNDSLTGHLKSADFFDVENFPSARFTSSEIASAEGGGFTVTGNLELHGVTKQISFPATIAMSETGVTAEAEFSINRFDFEIVYPGKTDDLIREEVLIKLALTGTA